jgi:hypothetical protein
VIHIMSVVARKRRTVLNENEHILVLVLFRFCSSNTANKGQSSAGTMPYCVGLYGLQLMGALDRRNCE